MNMSIVMIMDAMVVSGIIQVYIMMSLLGEVHTTGGNVVPKTECPFTPRSTIVGMGKIKPKSRAKTCSVRLFHGDARNL